MSNNFKWEDIDIRGIVTPKSVLLDFTNSFNEKFGRKLIMNLRSAQEQTVDWDLISLSGDTSTNKPAEITHYIEIQVPELDNYTLQILKVSHKVTSVYPCNVWQEIDDTKDTCDGADNLVAVLQIAIESTELKKAIINLLAQVC